MGLCHISELSDEPVLDTNSRFKAGDMVKAKILKASFIYGQTGVCNEFMLNSTDFFVTFRLMRNVIECPLA